MSPSNTDPVVAWSRSGDILVVTIDHPPVNALSVDVRRGLVDALDAAERDPAVAAVLIAGAGRNFIAGADIREFGKPPQPPALPDVCNRIEGTVVLRVLVGEDGSVKEIEIDKSSGSRDLDRAAREAVMKWKFKPGMRSGVAYAGWARVPINFTLP